MREKTLDIGGHAYKIKGMKDETGESGKGFLLGKHDVKKCEIYLDKEMAHSRTMETFLHEVIHVILSNTGNDHDETLIDSLSNGFHQLGVGDYLWRRGKCLKTS